MYKNRYTAAIILMGGKGNRFQSSLPKQFHRIFGKEIYKYSLQTLQGTDFFDEIILVLETKYFKKIKKKEKIKLVKAGKTRQESCYNGLLACSEKTDIVLIHDAVRPFITTSLIEKNLEKVLQHKAVNTCIPSFDTIVQTKNSKIIKVPKRDSLLRGQTPQTFFYPLILKAHKKALQDKKNFSCDASLAIAANNEVYITEGDIHNIKITTNLDILLAEQILSKKINLKKKNL